MTRLARPVLALLAAAGCHAGSVVVGGAPVDGRAVDGPAADGPALDGPVLGWPAMRLYLLADAPNEIQMFGVGSGGVVASIGAPLACDVASAIAADPLGRFLYVVGESSLETYAIGSDGALAMIAEVPSGVATGDAVSVVADGAGAHVYVLDAAAGGSGQTPQVAVFAIGSDGTPTALGDTATTADPVALALDHSGTRAYVGSPLSLQAFSIGSSGLLTAGSAIDVEPDIDVMVADPAADDLFIGAETSNAIFPFSIGSDGALVAGSGATIGTSPTALAVDPAGAALYAVDGQGHEVEAYAIDSSGDLLLDGSSIAPSAGAEPFALAVDPSSRYLYVAGSGGDSNIYTYALAADGSIATLTETTPTGTENVAMVAVSAR